LCLKLVSAFLVVNEPPSIYTSVSQTVSSKGPCHISPGEADSVLIKVPEES